MSCFLLLCVVVLSDNTKSVRRLIRAELPAVGDETTKRARIFGARSVVSEQTTEQDGVSVSMSTVDWKN